MRVYDDDVSCADEGFYVLKRGAVHVASIYPVLHQLARFSQRIQRRPLHELVVPPVHLASPGRARRHWMWIK